METTEIEKELTFEEMYPSDEDDEYVKEILKNKIIDYNSDDYDNLSNNKNNKNNKNTKNSKNSKNIKNNKNINDITKEIFKKNINNNNKHKYFFSPKLPPLFK